MPSVPFKNDVVKRTRIDYEHGKREHAQINCTFTRFFSSKSAWTYILCILPFRTFFSDKILKLIDIIICVKHPIELWTGHLLWQWYIWSRNRDIHRNMNLVVKFIDWSVFLLVARLRASFSSDPMNSFNPKMTHRQRKLNVFAHKDRVEYDMKRGTNS